jgi:hypothetical protein
MRRELLSVDSCQGRSAFGFYQKGTIFVALAAGRHQAPSCAPSLTPGLQKNDGYLAFREFTAYSHHIYLI